MCNRRLLITIKVENTDKEPTWSFITQLPPVHHINDLLGFSIFVLVCCNCIFGAVAVAYSVKVMEAKRINDYEAAKYSHKIALAMNLTGLLLTVIILATVIPVILFGAGGIMWVY